MKIAIIIGTRPEIIKMSPVIRECIKQNLDFFILHTNQHYSKNLDEIFFKELNLPNPKYNLNSGSGTHAEETSKILLGAEKVLTKEKPDVVLVQGDTNSVLSGALSASKLNIKIGHIEAGLRSYDRTMPEETNRILTDHISTYLFCPTSGSKNILLNEGISSNSIFVTGNTIVDASLQNIKISNNKSKILKRLNLKPNDYFLVTSHRQENVDNKKRFSNIIKGLQLLLSKYKIPLVYPIHPRAQKKIDEFNIKIPKQIRTIEPIGYLDFLQLISDSKLILTDSGGIQEEACIFKTPCITLRDNTERPETISSGGNVLAGTNPQKIDTLSQEMIKKKILWKNPFGTGDSAKKIITVLKNDLI